MSYFLSRWFPPAKGYQKALFEAGIPLMAFAVEDIQKKYERMEKLGVMFKTKPIKIRLSPTVGPGGGLGPE